MAPETEQVLSPSSSSKAHASPEQVEALVRETVAEVKADRTRLMDVVQAIQQRLGYIPDAAVRLAAGALGIHAIEVEDMVSFYAYLDRKPKGRFHIRLSKTPASLMHGAADVAQAFEKAIGIAMGATSPDGMFTLEWTADIGMADQEPAGLINGTVVAALTPADATLIVAALRGSQISGMLQLFPGSGSDGFTLPCAHIASSLVQGGPIVFRQSGRGDGVRAALTLAPEKVIEAVTKSRLRGRGGAGFPTGLKWKLCRQSISDEHYVVCNADEGEPGTFKDRVLLTEIPDVVFDGMTIAAYALEARNGLLYLRGEYIYLFRILQGVLQRRRRLGLLGANICGQEGFDFDIRIQVGAGAYVCGEESALIESLEGKRGAPRDRPPFPTEHGYRHQPTAVDNVETFACVARIMENGPEWFDPRDGTAKKPQRLGWGKAVLIVPRGQGRDQG